MQIRTPGRLSITTALLLTLLTLSSSASAQTAIQNLPGRETTSLDGRWHTIIDPYENGFYNYRYEEHTDGYFKNRKPTSVRDLIEYDFDTSPTLNVPGDWNSQSDSLLLYEGTIWYQRTFEYDLGPGRRLFVNFGAANYEAIVYVNGAKLGRHVGGFTPFSFEITGLLRPGPNDVIVKVDNKRLREGVPTVNTDWWNYGGLTREVTLVEVPETFVSAYQLWLGEDDRGGKIINGWLQVDGPAPDRPVTVSLAEIGAEVSVELDPEGYGQFAFPAEVEPWSPDHPKLYDVEISFGNDILTERMGFRTISVDGENILLNGEPVFLKGISIHEEAPFGGGRANSREDAVQLLTWAKELGCNFVRLAHYPHNEHMVREAERMGIMVWSEIPVYWTILFGDPAVYANAENQLTEMISRDRNRASIIIWSVANETPRTDDRLDFLSRLIERARELDGTRLISAATELTDGGSTVRLNDPLAERLDVIGVNEYFGWYVRQPEDIPAITWKSSFDKPLIITEFGAGAKYGYHATDSTRWSEEYQESLYRYQIQMLEDIPFLRGVSPWILVDFRSPRRPLPGIQDFWNRKGLISDDGERKLAFNVLRDWYSSLSAR
jgi:beta-glucuronidase